MFCQVYQFSDFIWQGNTQEGPFIENQSTLLKIVNFNNNYSKPIENVCFLAFSAVAASSSITSGTLTLKIMQSNKATSSAKVKFSVFTCFYVTRSITSLCHSACATPYKTFYTTHLSPTLKQSRTCIALLIHWTPEQVNLCIVFNRVVFNLYSS